MSHKTKHNTFTNKFNEDDSNYTSKCESCKKNRMGHDDSNTQLFYCKICWKQYNKKTNIQKIKSKCNKPSNIESKQEQKDANYPKITNYYSIPLCLKNRLQTNSKINLLTDYQLINPNIHHLFNKYNYSFFDNKLHSVQLKWNYREKFNAGYCKYNTNTNICVIELSALLLQYRNTKEVIETLIHEMIHSYLYIKQLNHDRTSHGCRFLSIMNVINYLCINKNNNLNISVRHGYTNEIEMNKSHKWKCNGICSRIIYRPICRPPGKHEIWWNKHQIECGGIYKIVEINSNKHNLNSFEWEQKILLKQQEKERIKSEKKLKKQKRNKCNNEQQKTNKRNWNGNNKQNNVTLNIVDCPICGISVHRFMINEHLDECQRG
eukprot:327359_1